MTPKESGAQRAARLPPPGLVGLDSGWSRLVVAPDHGGVPRTWHVLDNGVNDARITLLCVHGNPTWSYLWRNLVRGAPADVRVVAVDQLEMGFSERTGQVRRLADRIADLAQLVDAMALRGPVVTVAHDWGGPVSLGWAQGVPPGGSVRLAGVVLLNTAVHQPVGASAPALIRAVRTPGVLRRLTVDTTAFILGALAMSRPRLEPAIWRAYLAPYRTRDRRQGIADFVEDIPLEPAHASWSTLTQIADGMADFAALPSLLLWGPRDLVFSDLYLHDLERRLPSAKVHRFAGASHLLAEHADAPAAILRWLDSVGRPAAGEEPGQPGQLPPQQPLPPTPRRGLGAAISQAQNDPNFAAHDAVVELRGSSIHRISFGELHRRVEAAARGLREIGVRPGDRVALLVPPGVDLSVALFGCWRLGAVAVVVDAGLGARNMSQAFRSANPDFVCGIAKGLAAARVLGWPGRRILVGELRGPLRRLLGIRHTLAEVERLGAHGEPPPEPGERADAAVVFTSGSTGPSKGVLYRHGQLEAQRALLTDLYEIGSGDRLVAAFAPFALYGPALGITSIVPDMDVTRPATLTAGALADAAAAIDATLVFASPAAVANVVCTAASLRPAQAAAFGRIRLLLSAGAPVNPQLLGRAAELMPSAAVHTPYGMTEVLPVADVSLAELRGIDADLGSERGVCVGLPAGGVEVWISSLNHEGAAVGIPSRDPGVVGEILVAARHTKAHYDRLAFTEALASTPAGWHRSGDVGSLDDHGRLWVGGRVQHVVTTAGGPVLPVPLELGAETVAGVRRACAVGIGPVGAQVVALVIELARATRRPHLADPALAQAVRDACGGFTAAAPAIVLVVQRLPVDRRHNSKLDRSRVAQWASAIAAGGRIGRL